MATNKISTISFNVDVAPKAHDMGRNLLRGAGLTSLDSITEGGVTFYRINSFSDSLVKITDGIDGNKGVWVKTNTGETNVYRGIFFIAAVNKGETYTLSAWVKGTAGTTLYLEVLNSIGTARKNSDGTDSIRYTGTGSFATITDEWHRVTFSFTVDDLNGGYVECNFFTNAVGEFTICEPKLERGDVATAFCLNEADLKGDKGDKGDTPTIAKLRVDHSALHYNPTAKTWDYDSVTVTIVIFTPEGTRTPGNNDISEYYWLLDNDSTKRASGWGFSKSLDVASHTATLYKVGSNVAIDSITVPMVWDGHDGIDGESVSGADAVVYTIEAVGSSNNNSGTLTDDAKYISVILSGDLKLYRTVGSEKAEDFQPPQCWRLTVGGKNVNGTSAFSCSAGNNIVTYSYSQNYLIDDKGKCDVPGSATISVYKDNTLSEMIASLVIPITLNPGAIVDVNTQLGTINSTTASMKETVNGMKGTIETIKQGQGQISLKVQDLQNGGIDTGKPHTSSQVDFTTLNSDNFYPVMIKLKNDDGVRHTVEIDRPLNGTYGSGKGYMTHGQGFAFRLVFSDIANVWGSYEAGQLRIESILQRCTTPSDTPICPKIAQYNPSSFIVAWLRGGSKYDITVDCTDAYISGIWPYMMQVASNPSWVPDAVLLANDTWTTAQVNAQAGNPYNLLQHDGGGFYADTTNEYLYRFGSLSAGNTFAIVGQPSDSKQWFMATWHITRVSGSKVYVDTSTYGILWQAQNPLGIRMNGILGYIKTGASYAKSIWDSESGFGTWESIDNTAVHANWVSHRSILVIGTESGSGRDRAVLESVNSCSEGSSVSFFSGTYFDISPLYGTAGRANVKTDMLATGIDIKSHKILATADNFTVRNNSGVTTFSVDKDGNIVGERNAYFKGAVTATTFTLSSDKFYVDNNGNFKLKTNYFSVDENGKISATGGNISFFTFDSAGMYSGGVGQDGKIYSGLGLSMNNLSVSGNGNRRISSVFLGNGTIDSRFTNSGNRTVYRVGSTINGNTFYNYIKLERIGSGSFSYENSPEHAALGIETEGDFCLAALGGPSQFAGMCFASDTVSAGATANKNHVFYLCSGGSFWMPSDPPVGLFIVVIQSGSEIRFYSNGHKFKSGTDYNDTCNSRSVGQWTMFYFDGSYWNTVYMNGRPW